MRDDVDRLLDLLRARGELAPDDVIVALGIAVEDTGIEEITLPAPSELARLRAVRQELIALGQVAVWDGVLLLAERAS